MKAYHNSVVLRNDGEDPSTFKLDLNAGITQPVTVRISSTQALASIFDLDEVATANPLTTDNNGNYAFKANDDIYDIIVAEGTANEVKLEKVEIIEIQDPNLIINDLSQAYDFDTLADAVSSAISFPVGKVLTIGDITSTGDLVEGAVEVTSTSSVTPNGRNIIVSTGVATQSFKLRKQMKTYAAFTWYVDKTNGTDAFGQGVTSGTGAFKTIQYAIDSLPQILTFPFQQTIQLSNEAHNINYLPPGDFTRPAILSILGKITTWRTTLVGTEITGALVIKGDPADASLAKIVTTSAFKYGVYVQKGNIGLNHLSIESDGVNTANALLTAHRTDTYVHCYDVIVDGKDFSSAGIVVESTGQIEMAGECHIHNNNVNVLTVGDGDNVTISGNSTVKDAGLYNYQIQYGNLKWIMNDASAVNHKISEGAGTAGFFIDNGGTVTVSGQAVGVRTAIDDPIRLRNGAMDLKWCDTNGIVEADNGSYLFYNASNFTRNITCDNNSVLKVDGTNSTTTDLIPVVLQKGSNITYLGTNVIAGSGGAGVDFNVQTLGFNANNLTIAIQDSSDFYRVDGQGATRTGSTIETDDVESGRIIHLEGSTWAVTFANGAKMDLPVAGLTIGIDAGFYSGATFMNDAGIWRVVGLGFVR